MLLANILARENQPQRAADVYRDIIERAPGYAEAHNNLGLLWLDAGKLAQAKSEFEEAIHQKPSYAAAYYNLGLALSKLGDETTAKRQFETAHRLDPAIP